MDQTSPPHAIPIPYIQENISRPRLCQRGGLGQDATDFYGQHYKTDTTYLTPECVLNVAYTERCDFDKILVCDSVGVQQYIAQMFANQNYQNDLELMLGFNTDIETTQGVELQSDQQFDFAQSIHLSLQDQSGFDVNDRHLVTVSNTASFHG